MRPEYCCCKSTSSSKQKLKWGRSSSKARHAVGKNGKAALPVASGGGYIQQADSSEEQGATQLLRVGMPSGHNSDLVSNKMESNSDLPT